MDVALLAARVLLALVFGIAGVAKLADPVRSRQALRDFGLPGWVAVPVSILLPLVELSVAVALLPVASGWWGALGALGLLLAFVVGITITLLRGRRPACHCFGQLHSAPGGLADARAQRGSGRRGWRGGHQWTGGGRPERSPLAHRNRAA